MSNYIDQFMTVTAKLKSLPVYQQTLFKSGVDDNDALHRRFIGLKGLNMMMSRDKYGDPRARSFISICQMRQQQLEQRSNYMPYSYLHSQCAIVVNEGIFSYFKEFSFTLPLTNSEGALYSLSQEMARYFKGLANERFIRQIIQCSSGNIPFEIQSHQGMICILFFSLSRFGNLTSRYHQQRVHVLAIFLLKTKKKHFSRSVKSADNNLISVCVVDDELN